MITEEEVVESIMAAMPETDKKKLDPITLAILGALLSALARWLVGKCFDRIRPSDMRDPGPLKRWQLRRAIRQCSREVADDPLCQEKAITSDQIYRSLGDPVYRATLAAGHRVEPTRATLICGRI